MDKLLEIKKAVYRCKRPGDVERYIRKKRISFEYPADGEGMLDIVIPNKRGGHIRVMTDDYRKFCIEHMSSRGASYEWISV